MSEYDDECDYRLQSLLYEAKIMMTLKHPNLALAHRFGYKAGKAFLVMEYISGLTLEELTNTKPASENELISWMLQLTEVLDFINSKGYLYRDLKPQNIIICENKVKLVDFGLCMHMDQGQNIDFENLIGSPAYIPPERIEGRPEDLRSDMYSLGQVFFYAANGYNYFSGTPEEILMGHLHEERYENISINNKLSPDFSNILDRLMAREPDHRYQSYAELYQDLQVAQQPKITYKVKFNSPFT